MCGEGLKKVKGLGGKGWKLGSRLCEAWSRCGTSMGMKPGPDVELLWEVQLASRHLEHSWLFALGSTCRSNQQKLIKVTLWKVALGAALCSWPTRMLLDCLLNSLLNQEAGQEVGQEAGQEAWPKGLGQEAGQEAGQKAGQEVGQEAGQELLKRLAKRLAKRLPRPSWGDHQNGV